MDDKELYEMKLHEERELWRGLDVIRVPGGWIYGNEPLDSTGQCAICKADSVSASGSDELLCLIEHRKALVDCEISDYVTKNEGSLVGETLDILIEKKRAYELVILDLQT